LRPAYAPLQVERTLREQQARLEMTQAQVERVAARVEAAAVALRRANNDLARSEQLARQGFLAPSRLETERLAALAAEKDVDAANAERHIALHEVEQARAALMAVRNPATVSERGLAVRAPVAGRVLRVAQASEAVVPFGTPLLELGDLSTLEVVAELLTADAMQAQPGSPVVITRWGGPPLQGRVRRVEPAGFTKISALGVEEQRVRVLIDIASPPDAWRRLGVGYRVNVRIVTLAVERALTVPVSAVFPIPKGKEQGSGMAVYTVVDGRARLVPVQLGGRNDAQAWVRSGLDAGANVIIYPAATIADGVRVKVRSTVPPR
jgi:HlyD family secretion protein